MTLKPIINGLQVTLSDGGYFTPNRIHSVSKNQGKINYHFRIQKKWIKRFGRHWVEIQKRGETYIIGNHSLIVRKDDWPELQRVLDDDSQ